MKLSSSSQIEKLARFKTHPYRATSFYLNTDKSQQTLKAINAASKALINQARQELEGKNLSPEIKNCLQSDLEKISDFCQKKLSPLKSPGLAIFSCSGQNYWQELELPHGPRNRIIMDFDFYTRPLTAILERFKKMCVFLINRKESKWYEVYLGEIKQIDSLLSDVPKQVKKGGFEGYESKRIERHIEAHLLEHFKKSAEKTFDILKHNHFDWLLVGCDDVFYSQLESLFHSYLKERLKGRIKARPDTPESKILKECSEFEAQLKRAQEEELVKRFIDELERGGRAIAGLADTLRKLNSFEAQSLIITHNFSHPGQVCPKCHNLYIKEENCLICQVKTESATDIVDEAVELALTRGLPVYQITPPTRLKRYGNIGVFLKYKNPL
ncbi:MAG TPA: hypothetical protein PLP57_08985 [Candidatus Saccharicenans sp.]|jgi:peptide subunit release factor 1 (eRF1)|nr:hypothetical protein [Candidatus Saccharicenans sp.]HRD02758.1 hypothetical protein [Candidatus Saccharicenans sp.]